ncbi:hypothetical protein [Nocardia sp. NPDC048505]
MKTQATQAQPVIQHAQCAVRIPAGWVRIDGPYAPDRRYAATNPREN